MTGEELYHYILGRGYSQEELDEALYKIFHQQTFSGSERLPAARAGNISYKALSGEDLSSSENKHPQSR